MDLKPLFVFPRWSNTVTLLVLLAVAVLPLYVIAFIGYALDPVTLNVGYQPVQPVAYSHALHVGQLGLDCRYCHNTVEQADFAALPPTETCMNCHRAIWPKKDTLAAVRLSAATGLPVGKEGTTPGWRQVTTVPDYVYFNHAAHVNGGVGCVECHGQVNHMEVVWQAKPMNMAWCLQCHRDPASKLRPRDAVTKLDWAPGPEDAATVAVFASLSYEELQRRMKQVMEGKAYCVSGLGDLQDRREWLARRYVEELIRKERTDKFGRSAPENATVGELERRESTDEVRAELGAILRDQYHVNPSTDCITCHR